jgi:hypothetical protein
VKRRKRIPSGSADAIQFDSDRSCCVCRLQSKSVHLHHIDGNPANNAISNIAVLCHDHHSEATSTPGLGRGLSPGLIRKYRDEWLRIVDKRRHAAQASATELKPVSHQALLDALACHEVRKIRFALMTTHQWSDIEEMLKSLSALTGGSYSYVVRDEVLSAIDLVAGRVREGMPPSVAGWVDSLTLEALPITSLVGKERRKIGSEAKRLLRAALDTGFGIARDGIRARKDLAITAAGCRILFYVLRYATLNKLHELKREATRSFMDLEEMAAQVDFPEAATWLNFERADALGTRGDRLSVPEDLVRKVYGS